MNPGRELDVLIAEKVMGETIIDGDRIKVFECGIGYKIPDYSTDIAAAWEVVEKLDKPTILQRTAKPYICKFEWLEDMGDGSAVVRNYYAEGDTAPHAICLAALKAVGSELKK